MRWIRTVPRTALCSFSGSWSLAHVASHRLELAAFSPFPLSQCIYTSWHTLLIKPPFPHPLTAYGWNHRPCPVELFTIKLSKTLGLHNLVAMRCNRVRNSPWLCCQLRESFFFYRNVGQLCKNRPYMKTLKKTVSAHSSLTFWLQLSWTKSVFVAFHNLPGEEWDCR